MATDPAGVTSGAWVEDGVGTSATVVAGGTFSVADGAPPFASLVATLAAAVSVGPPAAPPVSWRTVRGLSNDNVISRTNAGHADGGAISHFQDGPRRALDRQQAPGLRVAASTLLDLCRLTHI